nr:hypothetical protein [Micromonospora sp. DSM 115978]
RMLISRLDESVRHFEIFLKIRRSGLDRDLSRWQRSSTEGKIYALRELRKWFLMPAETTLDDAESRVMQYVVALVTGELGSLPWEDPQPAIRRQRALRLFAVLRALLIAVTPAAIVAVAQMLPISLDQGTVQNLEVGALAWAAITIVIHLDPKLSEKIEVLQKIRNISGARSPDVGR